MATPHVPGAPKTPVPAMFWLRPEQTELVRAAAALANLTVIGAGSPVSSGAGASRDVGASLGAESFDDARRALSSTDATFFCFACADGADGDAPLDDPAFLAECAERGVTIATFEPAPASVPDLRRFERAAMKIGASCTALAHFVPAMRRSKGVRAALDAMENIGAARTLALSMRGGAAHGSLGARLYDAMDMAITFLGEPEFIDAAIAGPVGPGGVHLEPGETLREARGDLTAHLRYASERSASIALSDGAGRWFRGATLNAQRGCLRMDDKSFELIDAQGETVDRTRTKLSSGAPDEMPAAASIAEQFARLLDVRTRGAPEPPRDEAAILAMCEAALLSARTGQPESPATLLRMAGAV